MRPWALFPQVLANIEAAQRLVAVGESGLAVLWRAASHSRLFETVRPDILRAVSGAISFDPTDATAFARAMSSDSRTAQAIITGYRTANRVGCFVPAVYSASSSQPGGPSVNSRDTERLSRAVFDVVVQLVCGQNPANMLATLGSPVGASPPLTQGGRHTHPLAVRCIRELAALAMELGLPVVDLVLAVVDPAPATSGVRLQEFSQGGSAANLLDATSTTSLRRSATLSTLNSAAHVVVGSRGGKLLRALASEIESHLAKWPAQALNALLPHREANPSIAFEVALMLCNRCASDRVALVAFLEAWPAFCAPFTAAPPPLAGRSTQRPHELDPASPTSTDPITASQFNDFELLDFRLTALKVLVAQGNGVLAMNMCAALVRHDLLRCLTGTANGTDKSQGTYAKHQLLKSRKAMRLLSLASQLIPIAVEASATAANTALGQVPGGGASPDPFVAEVASRVSDLIRDEFPASLSEFDTNSVVFDSYLDVVQNLLALCENCAEPQIVLALLPLLRHQRHDLADAMRRAVARSVARMTATQRTATCRLALEAQAGALPTDVRKALVQRITLPALRAMELVDAERFFASEIRNLFNEVQDVSLPLTAPRESNTDRTVRRTMAFIMLEAMYRLCSVEALKGKLNQVFMGADSATATGKELTERLLRVCLNAKSVTVPKGSSGEPLCDADALLRYRQAAYSCLVALVMATQRQEKFFVQFLLREKSQDLWHSIVDLTCTHEFGIETRSRHQRSSIRDISGGVEEVDEGVEGADGTEGDERSGPARNAVKRYKYLSSQYLMDSNVPTGDSPDHVLTSQAQDSAGRTPQHRSAHRGANRANAITIPSTQHPVTNRAGGGLSALPRHRAMQYRMTLLGGSARGASLSRDTPRKGRGAEGFDKDDPPLLSFGSSFGHAARADEDDVSTALTNASQHARTGALRSSLVPSFVEVDDLWRGTCGTTILRLLAHMEEHFKPAGGGASHDPGSPTHYPWIVDLVAALTSPTSHINVKLTLTRFVCLCPALFESCANDIFAEMITLATNPALGKGVHYFVRDVCLTLLRWRVSHPPHSPPAEMAATTLLSFLVRNVSHTSKLVFRENLELLKCFVERWGTRVPVAKSDILGWLTYDATQPTARVARMCGIQICGVLVANGIPLWSPRFDAATISEDAFYKFLTANFSKMHREVCMASAEVAGMALALLKSLGAAPSPAGAGAGMLSRWAAPMAPLASSEALTLLRTAVSTKLMGLYFDTTPDKFMPVLERVARHYPEIVEEFLPARLLQRWQEMTAADKVIALELIALSPSQAVEIYHGVTSHILSSLQTLTDVVRVAVCNALSAFISHLDEDNLTHLATQWLPALHRSVKNPAATADLRVAFYNLAVQMHETLASRRAFPAALMNDVTLVLASGLTDPTLYIRDMLMRYWDDPSRLPLGSVDRFEALLTQLQAGQLGAPWLQYASILMLFAVHRSPDFNRNDAIFANPLTRCTFRAVSVDTTAPVRTLPLTPMFATQAQTPVARLETGLPASLGGVPSRPAPRNATSADGGIATSQGSAVSQSVGTRQGTFASFVPTLYAGGARHAAAASIMGDSLMLFSVSPSGAFAHGSQSGSSNGGGRPATPTPRGPPTQAATNNLVEIAPGVELRRRFPVAKQEFQVRRHILYASRQRQKVDVALEAAKQAQENNVHLYRTYRDGDVPDVQLSIQSFVVPLQALCLADKEIALTTASLLAEGVLGTVVALCNNSPSMNRASAVGGGGATTIPVSVSMFADVPAAVNLAELRLQRDAIRSRLRGMLRECHRQHDVMLFVHEQMLSDPQSVDSVDPATLFASCVGSGTFESGVLLLERLQQRLQARKEAITHRAEARGALARTSGRHAAAAPTPAAQAEMWADLPTDSATLAVHLDAIHDAKRETWIRLFTALEQLGETDEALAASRHVLPRPELMREITAMLRRGDLETALGKLSELLTLAAAGGNAEDQTAGTTVAPHEVDEDNVRDAAAAGHDDATPQRQRLDALAQIERGALAALLKWDAVVDNFAASLAGITETASTEPERIEAIIRFLAARPERTHERDLFVRSASRSAKAERRQGLLGRHAAEVRASFAYEVAAVQFEAEKYEEAVATSETGLRAGLRDWGERFSDDSFEAIAALQHLAALRSTAALFLTRRPSATRFAVHAQRLFRTWRAATRPSAAGSAVHWFDLLAMRRIVGTRLCDRVQAGRDDVDPTALRGVAVDKAADPRKIGEAVMSAINSDLQRALYDTTVCAGKSLGLNPLTNLASRFFLEQAIGLGRQAADPAQVVTGADGKPFDMRVWATVVRTTVQRAVLVQGLTGDRLRSTFGDIQEFMKNKADKVSFDSHTSLKQAYAELQGDFWAALCTQLTETEGTACQEEVVPMISKCVKKYVVALGTTSIAQIATLKRDLELPSSIDGSTVTTAPIVKSFASYAAAMLDFLCRCGGNRVLVGPTQQLIQTLAVATVTSVIRSMDLDADTDARRLFPRVLQALDASEAARIEFAKMVATVSTWNALPWIGLMLNTLLSGNAGGSVAPLVQRITLHYPQVVMYPYRCIATELAERAHAERAAGNTALVSAVDTLRDLHADVSTGMLRSFCDSLAKLHHPELRFRVWLDELRAEMTEYRNVAAVAGPDSTVARAQAEACQSLWRRCYADCFDASVPGIGTYNRKFAQDWSVGVRREMCDPTSSTAIGVASAGVLSLDLERLRRAAKLADEMRQRLQAKDWVQVTAFSETLASLQLASHGAAYVECPVQPFRFLNDSAPVALPRIAAVDPSLLVMTSLQRPKKLVLHTNASDRPVAFLVKGGDDLRLDQRIEELFAAINHAIVSTNAMTAGHDAERRRRCPKIRVYSVIPTCKKVGLVEWLDNTEPMKTVIERTMHRDTSLAGREPSVESHPSTKNYQTFVSEVDSHMRDMSIYHRYLAMFKSVRNRHGEHTARYREWVSAIDVNYLRDGLMQYAPSKAAWYGVRSRYITSTGALSAAGYVLGIGDRHLQNFLLEMTTGDSIAIDFGHAFGSATSTLPIPELMPFRMTPQMVAAFGLLGVDAVAPSMEITLRAIQRHRATITALMAVFLSEPLAGWEGKKPGRATENQAPSAAETGLGRAAAAARGAVVSELARKKVASVHRKIAMEHPVKLLEEEVLMNPHVERTKVGPDVVRVLHGEPIKREGPARLSSAAEQVAALLSIATDENILGRTWLGWAPLF
jgi:hypothetical protein